MIFAVRKRFDNEAKPLRGATDANVNTDAASAVSTNGNGAAH